VAYERVKYKKNLVNSRNCEGFQYLISILPLYYFPFGAMVILIAPLSDNPISSLKKTDKLSYQYKTTAKITVVYIIKCVPLATEPGISLIILTPMKILQRNLHRSTFVV
jgi:hypothetical protein